MFTQNFHSFKFARFAALVSVLLLADVCSAQPVYNVINLSGLVGNYSLSARGINDAGQIVLTGGQGTAYLYSNGNLTQIGDSDSIAWVTGINNQGLVVGYSRPANSFVYHGFIFDTNTNTMTTLSTAGGSFSYAYGINNLGQVTGQTQTADGATRAFLYDNTGAQLLSPIDQTFNPTGIALNDSGEVVVDVAENEDATHAFSYLNGTVTDLGSFGIATNAYAINNSGAIVGSSTYANNVTHAFLYDGTHLIDIDAADEKNSVAEAINDQGQIVGDIYGNGLAPVAFIYQQGVLTTLGSLLPLSPSGTPYNIGGNLLINNAGEIVCTAGTEVVLLTPIVPTPGIIPMMSGLLAGATLIFRRRSSWSSCEISCA